VAGVGGQGSAELILNLDGVHGVLSWVSPRSPGRSLTWMGVGQGRTVHRRQE
jgi:hypothetical protein